MKDFIHLYPNKYEKEFNNELIIGSADTSIVDYIITCMREFEAIENVTIENVKVVYDQDEVDINMHVININFKKKDVDAIEIPKYKYMTKSRYGEVIFTIRVTTNLASKVITKRILFPIAVNGEYLNNNKKMTALWQLVDASTYSQRGKITLKSRMPVIIYHNRNRIVTDVDGNGYTLPTYSYAPESKTRGGKKKTRFINPLMLYAAKMGIRNTIEFFGMKDIISIVSDIKEKDKDNFLFFPLDGIYIKVNEHLFSKYYMVQAVVCMLYNLQSKYFPVTYDSLEDREYWICRIGYIGSIRNKNIMTFKEKGLTTLFMVERLLDTATMNNLRLPKYYKANIYFLMYWMITNFSSLKERSNVDMKNKRIRRNEYIVLSSLGRKISENIHKLIERKSKSRQNTIDTVLELFNFNSDIVVSGMRNLNDLIKTDDIVNDMAFLADIAYSTKGFQSVGEKSSKLISAKYRNIYPSMVGKVDLNTSSNSDIGMSGSFTPYVKTYDGFYFDPNHEPCRARYEFDRDLVLDENMTVGAPIDTFEEYVSFLEENDPFNLLLTYEKIEIIEKERLEDM